MSDFEQFRHNLERYQQGPQTLRETLASIPAAAYDFRPSRPEAWTIKEHVVHVVDSDVSGFFRWRQALSQDGLPAPYQEEDLWTKNIDHTHEKIEDFLALMELIRKISYRSLKELDEKTVTTRTYNHPKGPVTLVRWAEIYANHVGFHIEYIERNAKEFQNLKN